MNLTDTEMAIVVAQNGNFVTGKAIIREGVVYQGGDWRPGAEISGFTDFKNECICSAINEGHQLHGTFDDDADNQDTSWQFWIAEASSEALATCQLLNATPYDGAVITTEDGFSFVVIDRQIVDNPDPGLRDQTYESLAELDVRFDYRVNLALERLHGEIGKHDWCVGEQCGDGYLAFVDDRPISYRSTPELARNLALDVIADLQADGDYRLNDKPQGFMPPKRKKVQQHNDYVRIEVDCSEQDQLGSFQNGTLQGFGEHLAITIQTHITVPDGMEDCTQQEAANHLREILQAASSAVGHQLVFDVQIGVSAESEHKH